MRRGGGEGREGGWYIEVPRLGGGLARTVEGGEEGEGEKVLDFAFFEVVHVDVDAI